MSKYAFFKPSIFSDRLYANQPQYINQMAPSAIYPGFRNQIIPNYGLNPGMRYLQAVKAELMNYNGCNFTVHVQHNDGPGLAIAGNLIIIDRRMLNYSRSAIAFVLAHEWGHQSLGHLSMPMYHDDPDENTLREDEADAFAAAFQARHHYDLKDVFLLNYKISGSSARDRNAKILEVYQEVSAERRRAGVKGAYTAA